MCASPSIENADMHTPIDLIVHGEHPPLLFHQVLCFYRFIALVFGRKLDKEMRMSEKGERERGKGERDSVERGKQGF